MFYVGVGIYFPMKFTYKTPRAKRDGDDHPALDKGHADADDHGARIPKDRPTPGLLVALAVTALPLAAQAQRKSPLADAPAIRKRYELRQTRFEIGVGGASTVNQDFYHTFFVGVKAGFHFTDWLSLAAFGDFAVANIVDRIPGQRHRRPRGQSADRSRADACRGQAAMQKITNILGAQLEFTPFTGKYSLFGKLFANYDFYGFVGGAMISVKPTDENALAPCQDGKDLSIFSCKVSGMKPGANLGVGFHSYFTNFLALNVELRDVIAKLNPAGRDVNGDRWRQQRPTYLDAHPARQLEPAVLLPDGPRRLVLRTRRDAVAEEEGHPLLQRRHADGDAAGGYPSGPFDLLDHPGRLAHRARGGPPAARQRAYSGQRIEVGPSSSSGRPTRSVAPRTSRSRSRSGRPRRPPWGRVTKVPSGLAIWMMPGPLLRS